MADYRTRQVAELLGVSVDTVRRWCDEGRLQTARSAGGHRIVDGADLARYLSEQTKAYEPESLLAAVGAEPLHRDRHPGRAGQAHRASSRSTPRPTASCR